MKTKAIYIYLLLLLVCCKKNYSNIHHDGLVINKTEGSGYEEVFYKNRRKNGVFLKYDTQNKLIEYGTYLNDKKDGLWSNITNEVMKQSYFEKDSNLSEIVDGIQLDWTVDTMNNFTFFSPKNWLIDLKKLTNPTSTVLYMGQTKKLDGEFSPQFNIVKLDIEDTLFNVAWQKQLKILSENNSYNIQAKGPDYLIYIAHTSRGYIYVYTKMIKTNKGYFSLGCLSSEKDYPKTRFVFKTMANSFNPIYLSGS